MTAGISVNSAVIDRRYKEGQFHLRSFLRLTGPMFLRVFFAQAHEDIFQRRTNFVNLDLADASIAQRSLDLLRPHFIVD